MHIDIGAPKNQEKKYGYIAYCIKNEAEHIVDNMVTERVTAYIRKNEKDQKDTDIINKIKLSMRILELLYQIIEKPKFQQINTLLYQTMLILEPERMHCTYCNWSMIFECHRNSIKVNLCTSE
jgi:hypothetical protein